MSRLQLATHNEAPTTSTHTSATSTELLPVVDVPENDREKQSTKHWRRSRRYKKINPPRPLSPLPCDPPHVENRCGGSLLAAREGDPPPAVKRGDTDDARIDGSSLSLSKEKISLAEPASSKSAVTLPSGNQEVDHVSAAEVVLKTSAKESPTTEGEHSRVATRWTRNRGIMMNTFLLLVTCLCAATAAITGYEMRKFVTAMEGTCEDLVPDGRNIVDVSGCQKDAEKLHPLSTYPNTNIRTVNGAYYLPGCYVYTGICTVVSDGPKCNVTNGTSANPRDCLCGTSPCINGTGFHCLASANSCTRHAVCDNTDATLPSTRNCGCGKIDKIDREVLSKGKVCCNQLNKDTCSELAACSHTNSTSPNTCLGNGSYCEEQTDTCSYAPCGVTNGTIENVDSCGCAGSKADCLDADSTVLHCTVSGSTGGCNKFVGFAQDGYMQVNEDTCLGMECVNQQQPRKLFNCRLLEISDSLELFLDSSTTLDREETNIDDVRGKIGRTLTSIFLAGLFFTLMCSSVGHDSYQALCDLKQKQLFTRTNKLNHHEKSSIGKLTGTIFLVFFSSQVRVDADTSFMQRTTGFCTARTNWGVITNPSICQDGAKSLQLAANPTVVETSENNRPHGCWWYAIDSQIIQNIVDTPSTEECSLEYPCVCGFTAPVCTNTDGTAGNDLEQCVCGVSGGCDMVRFWRLQNCTTILFLSSYSVAFY